MIAPVRTLSDLLERVYLVERPVGEGAAKQLTIAVRLFERWAGGVPLDTLDENLLSQWLQEYAKDRSPVTVRGKRNAILTIWRYGHETGYCPREPRARRVRNVRLPYVIPLCWTLDQLRQLVSTAEATPGYSSHSGIKWSLFWIAFVRVAYDTALRLTDVLTLEREQINDRGCVVLIQNKTGRPVTIQLRPATLDAIAATFPPVRPEVFPWPFCRETFYRRFSALLDAAGLDGSSKYLRRSSATYVERDHPGAARGHLGHSSPNMWRAYVNPQIAAENRPLPPAFDGEE